MFAPTLSNDPQPSPTPLTVKKKPAACSPPQGFLMSLDDFYLLGSGLLMTQTSIGVFNASLFSQLSPHSLLAWQRVRLANGLAHTGEEWAQVFSRYNSGEISVMSIKASGG